MKENLMNIYKDNGVKKNIYSRVNQEYYLIYSNSVRRFLSDKKKILINFFHKEFINFKIFCSLFGSNKNIKFSIIIFEDGERSDLANVIKNISEQEYNEMEVFFITNKKYNIKKELFIRDEILRTKINLFRINNIRESINQLLSQCNGDYICFYHAKDCWTNDHLKVINRFILNHPSCNILLNDSILVGDLDKDTYISIEYLKKIINKERNRIDPIALDKLFTYFCLSSICIKRDLLTKSYAINMPSVWIGYWFLRLALLENDIYFSSRKITFYKISKHYSEYINFTFKDFFEKSNYLILKKYSINSILSIRSTLSSTSCEEESMVRSSCLFDDIFYCQQEREALLFSEGVYQHFSKIGWKKHRDPSPAFSTKKYLLRYNDVKAAGCNPLIHYLSFGKKEGRRAFPVEEPAPINYFFDKDRYEDSKSILLVTHILNFTGAPVLLFNIAIGLKKKGIKPVILSPEEGPLMKRLEEKGIDLIIDPNVFVSKDAITHYKKYCFSLCVFNTYLNAQIYLYFKDDFPSILWIHEIVTTDSLPPELINSLTKCNSIFVPSRITGNALAKLQVKASLLNYPVPDKISSELLPRLSPKNIKFGIFGTFSFRKGQDILIDSLLNLPIEVLEKANFVFCGSIKDAPIYEKVISFKEKLNNNCIVMEQIEKESTYYQLFETIDFLICPSREDPYPLVVIDALMYGVPILISDRVGQSDLIVSGVNGFVFPSGNIRALSNLVNFIISTPNEINYGRMSDLSRKLFLNNFDFMHSIDNIVDLSGKIRH